MLEKRNVLQNLTFPRHFKPGTQLCFRMPHDLQLFRRNAVIKGLYNVFSIFPYSLLRHFPLK